MKPFDESTTKIGDIVYYRELNDDFIYEAKLIYISNKTTDYKFLVLYDDNGNEMTNWASYEELFIKPKTKRLWINLYDTSLDAAGYTAITYGYEEAAIKASGDPYFVKTIAVETEERS